MSGLPFSGKSYVVEQALGLVETDVTVISPKDFRVDDYDTKTPDERCEIDIACWQASLELLWDYITKHSNSEVIIYDTACASLVKMKPYFEGAEKNGHEVVFVYVQASLKKCEERAGDHWLSKEVIDSYKVRLKDHLRDFIDLSHKYIVIKNNEDVVPDVSKFVSVINSCR